MSAAMAALLRYLAAPALAGLCLVWVLWPPQSRVVRPRLGVPAVLAPGEEFELEIESSLPWATPEVRAQLDRADVPAVALELRPIWVRGARRGYAVRVPENLTEGSWTLVVQRGKPVSVLPKAVHLRREWPDELCLVQLADLPEFWPDGSGARAMGGLVDEINLIAPDLVLLSGDLAYGGSADRYAGLMAAIERFDAPVICVIGNHEYQGLSGYMDSLRLPQHVIDAGPLRIVSLNSSHGRDQFTLSALAWLNEALQGAGGHTPIVQAHHPPFGRRSIGTRQAEFIELCESFQVPIVMFGHLHADRVYEASGADREARAEPAGTLFAVATAAGAMLHPEVSTGGDYHGYRVVRLARAAAGEPYRVRSFTYDLDGDGVRDGSASFPAGRLSVTPLELGAARVTNESNEDLPRAHVWIDVAQVAQHPSTDVGRVLGVRVQPAGGPALQVGVELTLPAHSSVDVRVLP